MVRSLKAKGCARSRCGRAHRLPPRDRALSRPHPFGL